MEPVKIPSGSHNLAAVIHRSPQSTEKLAVLCPGFCDSKDYNHLVYLANELAVKGFDVVRFNPTGTWESEGSIENYTTTQYLEDIKNVLEYMLEKTKYKYILLGGHSYGGQVSLLYAATDSRISEVLAIMPLTPKSRRDEYISKWKNDGFHLSSRDIPAQTDRREFRVPYTHLQNLEKYNVFQDVKKIHVPIILITGDLEKIVLPEHVKEIFDNANEPKKFINIPGIGHDYRKRLDEVKLVNQIILDAIA